MGGGNWSSPGDGGAIAPGCTYPDESIVAMISIAMKMYGCGRRARVGNQARASVIGDGRLVSLLLCCLC